MSTYIASANIEVFPSAARTYNTAAGKYTSENNITGIIRSIADKDSFVVSDTEFVINGYYFKVNSLPSGNDLWAKIKLDSIDRLSNCDGGTNLDESNSFKGVAFETSAPTVGSKEYVLQIKSNGSLINKGFLDLSRVYKTVNDTESSLQSLLDAKQDAINSSNKIEGSYIQHPVAQANTLVETKTEGETTTYEAYSVGSNSVSESQTIIFNSGVPVNGIKIFKSTSAPESTDGNIGDLWFKYQA